MTQRFSDTAQISNTKRIGDDLLVEAACARSGCQSYLASEIGLMGDEAVNVYRPEAVVFDRDSLATFAGVPVTVGHPSEAVTSDNWAEHSVGEVQDEVARDGEKVRVTFRVRDARAIAAIEGGLREISMGYTTGLTIGDGVAPDGTPYRATQSGPIKINHLALVQSARGGSALRIGDGADRWGASPLPTTNQTKGNIMSDTFKTVVLGDKAANVAPDAAPIIEQFKADTAQKLTDAQAAHDAEIAAKDAEIAKKDAALDEAKAKALSDADLDKLVADRADLIGKARAIAKDVATAGQTPAGIRKAVVAAKLGDAAIADKSDAYIEARFDVLAEDAAKGDPFANTVKTGVTSQDAAPADYGHSAYVSRISDAWKGDTRKKEAS